MRSDEGGGEVIPVTSSLNLVTLSAAIAASLAASIASAATVESFGEISASEIGSEIAG